MASSVEGLREQIQQMIEQQQQIFQKQLELQQHLQRLELMQQQQQPPQISSIDAVNDNCSFSSPDTKTGGTEINSDNTGVSLACSQLVDPLEINQTQQVQHNHQNDQETQQETLHIQHIQHHRQDQAEPQQQLISQQRPNSCSYYMRLRHMGEHPEGMYTTYSPEWYIGNLGFRASLWPDNHGKSYCAALHLSYFSTDTTKSFTKSVVKCKVTLMDPLGLRPDCLLAEREAVFDGNRQIVDQWARGCVMVRIKMKDIKERGMCNDYTLLIRYDVSISM